MFLETIYWVSYYWFWLVISQIIWCKHSYESLTWLQYHKIIKKNFGSYYDILLTKTWRLNLHIYNFLKQIGLIAYHLLNWQLYFKILKLSSRRQWFTNLGYHIWTDTFGGPWIKLKFIYRKIIQFYIFVFFIIIHYQK